MLAAVCLAACAELAVRLLQPQPDAAIPDYPGYVEAAFKPMIQFDTREGRLIARHVRRHPFFPESWTIPLEKKPGRLRIVVLGESSAYLLMRDLPARVRAQGLEERIEFVHMAVTATTLEQVANRFNEALQLSPDGIMLLFGHALFYRHPIAPQGPAFLRPALLLLQRSRLVAWLNSFLFETRMPWGHSNVRGRRLAYREALSRMARVCRKRGIRFAVCTVPGNLHVPAGASPRQPPPEGCLKVKFLYWAGREEQALRMGKPLLWNSDFAWGIFQIGEWLYRAGRYDEARRFLQKALDKDPLRSRASGDVNAMIRDVVRREGLILLDFERLIARGAPHGIQGWESFEDNQHLWDADLEAVEVLRAFGFSCAPAPRAESGKRDGALALEHALANFPIEDPLARSVFLTLAESGLFRSEDEMEKAILAKSRDPRKRGALFDCFAEALWRAGKKEAAERFGQKALALAPQDAQVFLRQALLRLAQGRVQEARQRLQKALELSPGNPEADAYLRMLDWIPSAGQGRGKDRARRPDL